MVLSQLRLLLGITPTRWLETRFLTFCVAKLNSNHSSCCFEGVFTPMPWYWQCLSNQFDSIRFYFFHTLLNFCFWIHDLNSSDFRAPPSDDFKPRFIELNANIYCFAKRLSHLYSFQRSLRASFSPLAPLYIVWKSVLKSRRFEVFMSKVRHFVFEYSFRFPFLLFNDLALFVKHASMISSRIHDISWRR